MDEQKPKEPSVPNPAHYLGKVLTAKEHLLPVILSTVAVLAGSGITASIISDSYNEIPDKIGTEAEESIMAEHTKAITNLDIESLKLQQAQINQELAMKLGEELPSDAVNIADLKNTFSNNAQNTFFDIHLNGITDDEAAISEENFETLHKKATDIMKKHGTLKDLSLNHFIEAGALDECIADTNITDSNNDIARYNSVKELNQCMVDLRNDGSPAIILGGVGAGIISLMASMVLLIGGGEVLANTPKNIPLRRSKKNLPSKF